MKLSSKIVVAAAMAVIATTLASVITVYIVAKNTRINSLRDVMNTTLRQAEKVRDQFEVIHRDQGIDLPGLAAKARANNGGRPLKEFYATTGLYNTIPIVAAWQSVQEVAKQKDFQFYTPSRPGIQARNPKNATGQLYPEVFEAFTRGDAEYFAYDKTKNMLLLARPVVLTKNCLLCHGAPELSPTKDGLDFIGQPMENMKVGDVKGAFILTAPMTGDPVMRATMSKILLVGLLVLILVTAAFYALNQRMIIQPLRAAIEVINSSGEQTTQASSEIRDASHSLADTATQQAASLEETSASLEEIASVTKKNSGRSQTVKDLAAQARQAADSGARDMQEMGQAMLEIKHASDGIDKIIKTIDEIAFQTNILALNAAVEAARAGEAGLGFAVVADEVRNLAQRCAAAAKETGSKIEDSINKSNRGVEISNKVGQNLEGIIAKVRQVDEVIAEIAMVSTEQSQGIEQISVAVTQVDKVTQSNAAMSEQTASASEELTAQARSLKSAVEQLINMVDGGELRSNARTASRLTVSTAVSDVAPVKRGFAAIPASNGHVPSSETSPTRAGSSPKRKDTTHRWIRPSGLR